MRSAGLTSRATSLSSNGAPSDASICAACSTSSYALSGQQDRALGWVIGHGNRSMSTLLRKRHGSRAEQPQYGISTLGTLSKLRPTITLAEATISTN